MNTSTEVVPGISVMQLLQERDAVVENIRTASSALSTAQGIWRQDMSPLSWALGGRHYVFNKYALIEELSLVIRRIDACYWERLISQSGLRSSLSASARALWKEKTDSADVMEFTAENVRETFETYLLHREELLDEAILELFQSLSWDHKTNSPKMLTTKLIFSRFLAYGGGYPSLDHVNRVDDLNRALHLADGAPYPDHRNGVHKVLISVFQSGKSGECEFPYFTIRWFKTSGTAHILIKSEDLVLKLNRRLSRAAPNALPCVK